MKTVSYSIVCEDAAHYYFLKCLLGEPIGEAAFLIDEACYTRFKCATKKEVLNSYIDIANKAFREYPIDILFVMVDHDDEATPHADYHKSLAEPVFKRIRDKVIIAIPVKCIEHWLRYLQWKKDNPNSTKNESMEGENRPDSKVKIYGSKKPSRDRVSTVIDTLLDSAHTSWLSSRSESFNHFYTQIQKIADLA